MASTDEIAPGAGSAPNPSVSPPPPEWMPVQHPWEEARPRADDSLRPTSPPLGGGAAGGLPPWGGPPPPPPPPPLHPSTPSAPSRPQRITLAIVAALLVGALVGAGIGKVVHLQGARPTLSGSSAPPTTSLLPGSSGGSASPSNPTAPSGGASGGNQTAITAAVSPSIVDVNTVSSYRGGAGAGTGMILTSDGDILTNNHVVDEATNISVTLVSTGRVYKAEVVGTAPAEDIAVIHVNASGLKPISIGNASAVALQDAVLAIGNAGGKGGAPTVVTGSVLALHQTITASDVGGANPETLHGLIRTDAPIQPGDSGGALVNTSAEVIGMNTAASANRQFSGGASEGFAIPIDKAVSVARQIESGKASSSIHIGVAGFLGVAIEPPQSTAATSGAVVAGVGGGSPADDAGLVAGDTITSVNGTSVTSPESLSAVMRTHRGGEKVTVGWTGQDGNHHSASVTLITGPAD